MIFCTILGISGQSWCDLCLYMLVWCCNCCMPLRMSFSCALGVAAWGYVLTHYDGVKAMPCRVVLHVWGNAMPWGPISMGIWPTPKVTYSISIIACHSMISQAPELATCQLPIAPCPPSGANDPVGDDTLYIYYSILFPACLSFFSLLKIGWWLLLLLLTIFFGDGSIAHNRR